jgi:hypothetical protein
MIRRYIQRRWGTRLMRLLWGKPTQPSREYVSRSTIPLPPEREWRVSG